MPLYTTFYVGEARAQMFLQIASIEILVWHYLSAPELRSCPGYAENGVYR